VGLTSDIAAFVADLTWQALPPQAPGIVATGFVDCIAVAAAGWDEPAPRTVRAALGADPDAGFLALDLDAPDKGLALAVAAHVLDYDDTGLAAHPSAVLVPAVLAAAEGPRADGRAMTAAYVAGYETWAELARREPDPYHAKGWHPTAVLGTIAAAAAAGRLRGLDAARQRNALAIAASMAGGVVANFGTMTKSYQVGRAVRCGLEAARLAAAGLDGAADALEHELGLLAALSPRGRADRTGEGALGADWAILRHGLNIKRFPVCYALHRAIDGMIALRRRHGFAAGEVEDVRVRIGATQAAMLHSHRPQTVLEAKFSLEFAMAATIVAGRLGFAELDPAFVRRGDIQALMGRVHAEPMDEADPDEPAHSPFDQVLVRLKDDRVIEGDRIAHAPGHFRRPLAQGQLREKFDACTAGVLAPSAAAALFDALSDLPSLKSATALRQLARPLAEVS